MRVRTRARLFSESLRASLAASSTAVAFVWCLRDGQRRVSGQHLKLLTITYQNRGLTYPPGWLQFAPTRTGCLNPWERLRQEVPDRRENRIHHSNKHWTKVSTALCSVYVLFCLCTVITSCSFKIKAAEITGMIELTDLTADWSNVLPVIAGWSWPPPVCVSSQPSESGRPPPPSCTSSVVV